MAKFSMTKQKFTNQWLRHFASDVPKKELEKYVTSEGNFLWHVFSWKLIPDGKYLSGDEAKRAYDEVDKNGAIYVDWFKGGFNCMTPEFDSAESLEEMIEVYVTAADFSWTYIKTHEDMCGPYFMKTSD